MDIVGSNKTHAAILGGNQIDYADESDIVRNLYREAMARHGLEPKMDAIIAAELETLPPKPAMAG